MKKSQIWVETVIYTLIIIVIIGILLSILTPAIESKKDQIILEKSLEMIEQIDSSIEDARYYGAGNSIPVDLQIKKGKLIINAVQDYIIFEMKSSYMYSEPNQTITRGKINITTIYKGKNYDINFKIYYNNINLTYNKKDMEKVFNSAPTPQKLIIANYGKTNDFVNIDLNS